MAKKYFNCLPDEIIQKICLYLDAKSLKHFALSSTRCANVVGNSALILRKFKLKLTGDFLLPKNKKTFLQLLSSQRKYSTIEVADIDDTHYGLLNVFETFGAQLRILKISNSKIHDFILRGILKSSSHLQELFLSEVTIVRKLPVINPVSIVHLKSLTIQHCDWIIFRLLSKSQIKSLVINNYCNEGNRNHLVDFLTQQYLLKELTLHGTSSRILFQQNNTANNFKFNLSTFHIGRGFGKNSDAVNCNIIDFLSMNVKTLTNVEISVPNCDHISSFILTNLNSMRSLTLDVRGLPKDRDFYDALSKVESNMQLEALKLSGFFVQLNIVKVILKKYPAIKCLELDDWSSTTSASDMLKFVSVNFPHLQQLYIKEIPNGYVRFDELKHLSVTYIRNTENLIDFIKMNRSVEELRIRLVYIEQISSEFINDLMDLNHLHHLSFSGNDKALRMILDIIGMDTKTSLKTLELSVMSYEKSSNFTTRKTIKLSFPIDSFEFNLKLNVLF